jgi:DNA-binding NarL/FixJ family response regulator
VLEAAQRLQPDAVVLDVSLPGHNGLQVLPALRALLPRTAIVMLTAHAEPAYRKAAYLLGADAFLSKTSAHALVEVVRAATKKLAGSVSG